ncbi:MAG: type II secretion system protein GspF [Gammaproteobacteria bacterium]|nr:MAG: type II secretion system protein GspF [Gammaproteobacteria bacterium]
MGAFAYRALDPRGRERRGVLEADTPRQVRQLLRERGWAPLAVEAIRGEGEPAPGRAARGGRRWRLGAAELALLTRQLATLVRAGLPVEEALQALARQADKPRTQSLILGVRARVLEGHSLAAALGAFPRVFPDLYRATVAAGEESGHLDAVLERLADYTESRQDLRQRTLLALLYPALVVGVSLLVVGLLMVQVVPQIVQVFQGLGQELPWLTRALIALSEAVRQQGAWWLAGLALALLGARALLRRPAWRRRWHALLLRLPLVGRLLRGLEAARFARTLAILAGSGVPVLQALRIAGAVVGNLPMREAVEEAARRVREGSALHAALEAQGLFPPLMVHLIASGEASGRLEAMLERAAATQERELEVLTGTLTELLGPVLILLMGGLVLAIVLAILLPIFDLNRLVR